MHEERFTFGTRNLDLLERHRAVLESFGFECRVEVSTVARFELHTLVAVPPKNECPVKFTRALGVL